MKRRFFGLNKKRIDTSKNYFTIEVLEDGQLIKLSNYYEYCIDDGFWNKATPITLINANAGLLIYFKGSLTPSDYIGSGKFTITKKCNLSGNIMSLLYGDEFEGQTDLTGKDFVFLNLFWQCDTIIDASQLILPATTLANYCYSYMFISCTSLTSAPELPATTLAQSCYSYMFYGCESLTTSPKLPATTLAQSCYYYMFYGTNVLPDCTNIDFTSESVVASGGLRGLFAGTNVTDEDLYNILPINPSTGKYWLPATTLAQSCYSYMFYNCSSLVTAPELPAKELSRWCYDSMFKGCTSLTAAPELPATILSDGCYDSMFYGCSKLNYIKALFTTTPSSSYTYTWVNGVSSTGTFVKSADATWDVIGVDGIPTGWTVENYAETNLITFTIDGTEYQAEEGMTWKEWVNSKYNTDGYVLYLSEFWGDIYDSTGNMSVAFSYDTFFKGVKASDLIESDYRYSLYLF